MSIKYYGKRKVKPTNPGEILREYFMPDYNLNVAGLPAPPVSKICRCW